MENETLRFVSMCENPSTLVTSFEMTLSATKQELFSFEEAFADKSMQQHWIDLAQETKLCAENRHPARAGRFRNPHFSYEPTLPGNPGTNCERKVLQPFRHRAPMALRKIICPMSRSSAHLEIEEEKKVNDACRESRFRRLNSRKSILEMKGSKSCACNSHAVRMILESYDCSEEEEISFVSVSDRRYQWFAPHPIIGRVGDMLDLHVRNDGNLRGSDVNDFDGVMYTVFYDTCPS